MVAVRVHESIVINIHRWHDDPVASTTVAGRQYQNGYFDYEPNPLTMLTAGQLQRVALCRNTVEWWVAGELAELPTDPPKAAVRNLGALE